jgi:preprotein translocase subunit SecE
MSSENVAAKYDGLKWLLVALIVAAGVYGNSVFSGESLLYRVVALLVLAAVALAIALKTEKGHSAWSLIKGARTEIRKVVWPTRQETVQTTLIVVAFVLVVALILWGLDSFLGWLVSLVIG